MKKRGLLYSLLFLISGLVCGYFFFSFLFPPSTHQLEKTTPILVKNVKSTVHYAALGDSLTQGVGDTAKQGGFVGILKKDLSDHYKIEKVTVDNFGKNGDRSDQILKRLQESEKQQNSLKKADLITLTAGGNDLMKVIRKDLFKQLTLNSFKEPGETYQKNLTNLIQEIRSYTKSPIYLMGIYNPFYVYFTQMGELEEIVDYWNKIATDVVAKFPNVYFISSSELLSKGSQNNMESKLEDTSTSTKNSSTRESTSESLEVLPETSSSTTDSSKVSAPPKVEGNEYISDEDNFHPNRIGYQLIAQAFNKKLEATQEQWLQKK